MRMLSYTSVRACVREWVYARARFGTCMPMSEHISYGILVMAPVIGYMHARFGTCVPMSEQVCVRVCVSVRARVCVRA